MTKNPHVHLWGILSLDILIVCLVSRVLSALFSRPTLRLVPCPPSDLNGEAGLALKSNGSTVLGRDPGRKLADVGWRHVVLVCTCIVGTGISAGALAIRENATRSGGNDQFTVCRPIVDRVSSIKSVDYWSTNCRPIFHVTNIQFADC